jgi:hypothetical protein
MKNITGSLALSDPIVGPMAPCFERTFVKRVQLLWTAAFSSLVGEMWPSQATLFKPNSEGDRQPLRAFIFSEITPTYTKDQKQNEYSGQDKKERASAELHFCFAGQGFD